MTKKFFDKNITTLEETLNYRFTNPDLAKEALSHPSLKQLNRSWQNYERLELLGDAVLGFLITELLFHRFTGHNESILARAKACLVCKETLCKIATDISLADYIIMTSGEETTGGRFNPNNVENALEALIAAIYLDSDIITTQKIVSSLWTNYLDNIDLVTTDPKTHLQEWAQENKLRIPKYNIINRTGPDHAPVFTIEVIVGNYRQTGIGNSRKSAEKAAAWKLLSDLQ